MNRYYKINWTEENRLPPQGKLDNLIKQHSFTMYEEGEFLGEHLEVFPAIKHKRNLKPFGRCVYCDRETDIDGRKTKLTSEHVIPEFLGAGLELPESSCQNCQVITSKFENSIAEQMFNPIRKSLSLIGKNGTLKKNNFLLDVGREKTKMEYVNYIHYPTILVLPMLYPASVYSRRQTGDNNVFNIQTYNINATKEIFKKYDLENFSSSLIDLVQLAQMLAKISHVYVMHYFRKESFTPTVAKFIRKSFSSEDSCNDHLDHVGCLWKCQQAASDNLHEIEVGKISWNNELQYAARVRLFACYGMPSYFVTVGRKKI